MITLLSSVVFAAGLASLTPHGIPEAGRAASAGPSAALARPVFLENLGQWSEPVRFRRHAAGTTAWFVDDGWWLVLRGATPAEPGAAAHDSGATPGEGWPAVALRMQFEEAREVQPQGLTPAPGRHNFFRGNDPRAWVRGARSSERVVWPGLYEGVDLIARDAPGAGVFEYDLDLAPGADLGRVRVALQGHTGLRVDTDGSLVVTTEVGTLIQPPPLAWQWRGDERLPLECRFRVLDDEHFGFAAPDRDPELPAVVDPALLFSTYLSGQLAQTVEDVCTGPSESVYVAGWTLSDDFPATPGAFQEFLDGNEDGFVSRLSSDGTQLIWSTYLGGAETETLLGLAVDGAGTATVCGQTRSSDYPTVAGSYDTTPNGFADGFVTRIAPGGDVLAWSTYLGGGLNDVCSDVALDASGAATVAGATNGSGFPAFSGFDSSFNGGVFAGDAFVSRLSPDGKVLVWSTFLGGSQDDGAQRVAVESTGEVSVSGVTTGSFPVTFSAFDKTFTAPVDTFVSRLSANGKSLVYATYIGNVAETVVRALALDGSGEVVLLGRTEDAQFPRTPGAFRTVFEGPAEGFYTRLSSNGGSLIESSFIGGAGDDEVVALARDTSGRVLLAGNSTSEDLPTTPGAFSPEFHDNLGGVFADAFLLRFEAGAGKALGTVEYGTYFGTSSIDTVAGFGLDGTGAAVLGGNTDSFQFPTTPGALQETFNLTATGEGFAARLDFLLHPISYGSQPVPGAAQITWTGFPGLAEEFAIEVQSATPLKPAILFHGFAPQANPFYGRTILVQPPLFRHRPVKVDVFGYKSLDVDLQDAWLGQTVYFQWWYKDPFNPKKKTGLSDALQVLVHP